jgi:agmatinase
MFSFAFMSNNTFLKVMFFNVTYPSHFWKADHAAVKGNAPYSIAGIPFDGATTNRPGARFGPSAIRQASHMLCDGTHPYFGVSPTDSISDQGDLNLPNTSLSEMRKKLEPMALELIKKHHMIWLGGDHSVTLSLLRAYRAHHGLNYINEDSFHSWFF